LTAGRWIVDGMNVIGSRPTGWWRDRPGAMRGLVEELEAFAGQNGDEVTVVFDGRPFDLDSPSVDQLTCLAGVSGLLFALNDTTATIATAARPVGRPRFLCRADAVSRTPVTIPRPATTNLPLLPSGWSSD